MSILNRPGWLNQLALNEMRSSRHAGLLDLSIVQKQLADKKIGIPYRDARRFLFDFLRDNGVVEGSTPQAAKDVNAIVGALVTDGKITADISNMWNDYISDISNLERFIGTTRAIRGRLTDNPEEGNRPATIDEIKQRIENRKFERKLGSATSQLSDIEGFDEFKLIKIGVLKNMLNKAEQNEEILDNPKYIQAVDLISKLIEQSDSIETLTFKLDRVVDNTDSNELLAVAYLALQSISDVIPQSTSTMDESTNTKSLPDVTKLSPQAQDRLLKETRRKNLQHKMAVDQKYFGY